jgi:endonuclease/exonuclease/phosphatase family metal-dependent hydrolase
MEIISPYSFMNKERLLTVGTFNIRGWSQEKDERIRSNAWVHRAPLTLATIAYMRPDFLGFQEFSEENASYYRDKLGMRLYLGAPIIPDRYNPIAFNSDIFQKQCSGVIWLSKTDEPIPDWDATETRSATYGIFEDHTGKQILFLNTHFDNVSEVSRVEGTKKIIRWLDQFPDDLLTVVVGDYNSSYYQPHERTTFTSIPHDLFFEAGFEDAFMVANPDKITNPPNTFHNYEGAMYEADQYGTWHTDWILYKGGTLESYEIVHFGQDREPFFPSDHYPVRAQFR